MRALLTGVRFVLRLFTRPLLLLWNLIFRPITLVLYKIYIVFIERLRVFFHAQHKLIALLSHRFALHVIILSLTGVIVVSNIAQAQTVQTDEFAKGALISRIFNNAQDTTITADTNLAGSNSYLDTSGSVRMVARLDAENATPSGPSIITNNPTSSVALKSTGASDAIVNRNEPVLYTVQSGDTISSIAAKFNISVATVLWVNNLSETSFIQPGYKMTILPTSGVEHIVASGETAESIAKKYNAKAEDILSFNRLISNRDLTIGMKIIVPGGEKPAPVVTPRQNTQLATVRNVFFNNAPANAPATSSGKYVWPTTDRRVNSPYGYRAFDGFHPGIDIEGVTGNPVYAGNAGTVRVAGWSGGGYRGGYGIQVLVDHGNGVQTRYGHLSKVYVTAGQSVSRGQTVGAVGATGNAYGDHLHFECIINGRQVNPIGNCL